MLSELLYVALLLRILHGRIWKIEGKLQNGIGIWAQKGEWPAFTSDIERICDLPKLDALKVRFSDSCVWRNGDLLKTIERLTY